MTQCPVCGMEIEENSAKKVVYNGQTYLVASDNCKTRFQANPAQYAAMGEHSGHQRHSHKHGCC